VTENLCPSCERPLPLNPPGGLCPACALLGAWEQSADSELPGLGEIRRAFPQFEIVERIGRGGMGVVFRARQPQLDRQIALKILLPGLRDDPGFAERFAREARALAKLSHPNIVAIHDFGETAGFFWLTMEYVDGVNLRQAMQAARFTPEQALAIIPELCAALQYAHDHGILHRDIKPENILLDARGRVKVADFGIARIVGDDRSKLALTQTGSALGSAAYIAPEQIERPHDVDHRADLYSLGVVFYEMLTGGLPLGRFPVPSEHSGSDPRLDEVVFRTLEKQREKRYQSADAIRDGVSTARDQTLPQVPATHREPPRANLVAWSLGLTLGGATFLAIAAAAAESVLLAAPGACAVVLGIAAGWWALWRMRKGEMPTGGRVLLRIFVVWLPLLGIGSILAVRYKHASALSAARAKMERAVRHDGLGSTDRSGSFRNRHSTPQEAAESLISAARAGDMERFKEGLSEELLEHFGRGHDLTEPLRDFAGLAFVQEVWNVEGLAKVRLRNDSRGVETEIYLLREENGWKLATPAAAGLRLPPMAAVEVMLQAARHGDVQTFRSFLSKALDAEMDKELAQEGANALGDFKNNVTAVSSKILAEARATVVVQSGDNPSREVIFEMTIEEGGWKLNNILR